MKKKSVAGLLGLIFFGCINDPQPNKTLTLNFPLSVGKIWEYESVWSLNDSTIDSTTQWTSITSKETDSLGFAIYEFKDSADGNISYDYYQKRNDGIYIYASTPGGLYVLWKSKSLQPGTTLNSSPVLLAPSIFNFGNEWIYDTLIDSVSQTRKPLRRSCQGRQQVITKAGTFDCYKFETSGYMNEKRYHYYSPSIGLVMKEEVIDSFGVSSVDPVTAALNIQFKTSVRRSSLVSTN